MAESCCDDVGGEYRCVPVALLGSLLGSSCCVVQLCLNALNFGCAGFAVLDPYRPVFLTLSTLTLGWKATEDSRRGRFNPASFAATCLATASLALSPFIVRWYNRRGSVSMLSKRVYDVAGLKCEACAAGLRRTLSRSEAITSVSVRFESKAKSTLLVGTDGRIATADASVAAALKKKGFDLIQAS
eukprot:TRINITY_DN1769_c0_g2_i1.p1 TRINITY_DN1769_c0_g2~~TRINITY_DN1769_c0_g2_i1.p1  ORF type:complete len:186 (+),score=35.21 TRINITY_DN1769_c0_g2_i1:73-630(+)